jgi:hypothetical protein
MNYDSLVITLILLVDAGALWVNWKMLQERQKQRIRRVVSRLLTSLGVPV